MKFFNILCTNHFHSAISKVALNRNGNLMLRIPSIHNIHQIENLYRNEIRFLLNRKAVCVLKWTFASGNNLERNELYSLTMDVFFFAIIKFRDNSMCSYNIHYHLIQDAYNMCNKKMNKTSWHRSQRSRRKRNFCISAAKLVEVLVEVLRIKWRVAIAAPYSARNTN